MNSLNRRRCPRNQIRRGGNSGDMAKKNWCSVAVGCGPLPRTQNKHGVVVGLKKARVIEYSTTKIPNRFSVFHLKYELMM